MARQRTAKTRGTHAGIWRHSSTAEPVTCPPIDLDCLGDAVRALPPAYWETSMLFRGAPDSGLREATGVFPATFRSPQGTHPLFVLERLPGLGHRVCPCSTKNFGARRRIRAGCELAYTGRRMDRDSYLVESCTFNLPRTPAFLEPLRFLGLVPPDCLEDCGP